MTTWTSGRWTKCTFSSRDRVVACGCHPRPGIPVCIISRRAKVSATSPPCACGTANFCFGAKPDDSTESFWEFLKVFQQASRVAGRRVVAISDNAQYHRSKLHLPWRQQQAPQFGLDFLPPYSPDLNPIERVWKLTRRLCLHNRYFGFLDGLAEAVENQFADWIKPNETLRRLCAIT